MLAALLFSLWQPFVGVTLGLLYIRQEDRAARSFARWCFAAAVMGWVLAAIGMAFKAAAGAGEWFVQPYY